MTKAAESGSYWKHQNTHMHPHTHTCICTHTLKERVGARRGGMAAATINAFRMTYGEKLLTGRRANEVQTSSESFNDLCLFKNTT